MRASCSLLTLDWMHVCICTNKGHNGAVECVVAGIRVSMYMFVILVVVVIALFVRYNINECTKQQLEIEQNRRTVRTQPFPSFFQTEKTQRIGYRVVLFLCCCAYFLGSSIRATHLCIL